MYARARDEKESAPFFSFFLPPRVLSLSCDSRFAAALVTATPYTARVRVPLPIILFFAVRQCYHSAAKLTGLHLFFFTNISLPLCFVFCCRLFGDVQHYGQDDEPWRPVACEAACTGAGRARCALIRPRATLLLPHPSGQHADAVELASEK